MTNTHTNMLVTDKTQTFRNWNSLFWTTNKKINNNSHKNNERLQSERNKNQNQHRSESNKKTTTTTETTWKIITNHKNTKIIIIYYGSWKKKKKFRGCVFVVERWKNCLKKEKCTRKSAYNKPPKIASLCDSTCKCIGAIFILSVSVRCYLFFLPLCILCVRLCRAL